ncbi:hypothetical protein [Streptosporangium sp. KLBMP 9127]|nr:hypothetical protein [Streptosporangium sp. KLBMP 9127]
MRVRSILSVTVLAGGLTLFSPPAHATGPTVERHSVIATDIVLYECDVTGETDKQSIAVTVELTMPTGAITGEQMTIGWRGTYADGSGLTAPAAGLAAGTKLYAYASISDLPGVTSATGVGELGTVGADAIIPLPTTVVDMRTTSSNAGTASVKPAAINFGTSPTQPSIECEATNADTLTTYPLPVTAADQTTSPSPSPSPTDGTTSPTPTQTATDTTTEDPVGGGDEERTPVGGADTGGGGETGPDARPVLLTGLLLIIAALAGLLLRRRSLPTR